MSAAAASPRPTRKIGPAMYFTRRHHDFDDLLQHKVSGFLEFWLVGYIERRSIGVGLEKTDPMPFKELAARAPGSGDGERGCSMSQIQDAVKRLEAVGIIGREKIPGKREYRYWTTRSNWEQIPDYVVVNKEKTAKESKENISGGPDISIDGVRIKPGHVQTIEIAQTGHKIHTSSDTEVEVAIQPAADKEFRMHIGSPKVVAELPRARANPDVCSKPARSAPAAHPASEDAAAVRDFLLARFVKNHATLSRQTLLRIWGAIQKSGANLEQYKELVRAREKRGKITAGTYVLIAEKDLAAYIEQQREVERKGRAAEPPEIDAKEARRQQRKQTVADYLRWKAQKACKEQEN